MPRTNPRRFPLAGLLGTAFLLAQLGAIVYARFVPSRYFCWAPNDTMVEYRLAVKIGDRPESPQQIEHRYHEPATGVYQAAVQNLIDSLQQYEQTYGRDDHAQVVLAYRVNRRAEQQWRWPLQ